MEALRSVVAAALLLAATPLRADEVGRWRPLVAEASERFGVPADWIERVMRAESGGRTRLDGRPIRSAKGAIGLMQLMPGTWSDMRTRLGLGRDPDDPRDNIMAGTFYLRQLYDRFGYPGLFAAYNAGPARYEQYLAGRPLPAETRAYLAGMGVAPDRAGEAEPQTLFLVRRDRAPGPNDGDAAPPVDPLFAVRTDAD
ncbi:lytic transglycosylase [Novosphingobium endophyticum]|uniref:Lytic transglycosylase n=1 Tax=Novosphingobium endophyticum TaxID=1955250 RepID=A0A916TSZ3_9SPHN|nr:lytic transglycosylase domain-containing protein [Novosphingobium endophyticum]GGC04899.1 lytic transglycosylase [Novosphingobium endophyticum]